jgi:aminopeptidase
MCGFLSSLWLLGPRFAFLVYWLIPYGRLRITAAFSTFIWPFLGLRGAHNLAELWDIPANRLSLSQAANGKVSSMRWAQTRWCLVRVPNADFAQQAGVDLDTVMDMFFSACLLDWPAETARYQRLAEALQGADQVRIVGKDTDLSFSIQGRRWMIGDGKLNMPDGEMATAPLTETIDGQIYFEFPGVLGGRLVHDMRLRWKQGELVEATASTNQDFLRSILSTDTGAKLIGEFAMGTNPGVNLFCKGILIDEKIGGTIHIALGRAYPE